MKPLIVLTLLARVAVAEPTERQVTVPEPTDGGFALGALVTTSGDPGLRIQTDVLGGGTHWSLGLAGTVIDHASMGMDTPLASGLVYLAHTRTLGPIQLRAQFGISTSAALEDALLVSVPLVTRWAIIAGPIAQVTGGITVMGFAGLLYR